MWGDNAWFLDETEFFCSLGAKTQSTMKKKNNMIVHVLELDDLAWKLI
jgi:hypothetical protein